MNAEEIILQVGPITVTNARFIVGGQTFVIRNITSVEFVYHRPSRAGPIALILIGIICALLVYSEPEVQFFMVIGIALATLGLLMLVLSRTTYEISLVTSGGQLKALSSKDKQLVTIVADALNRAIVSA
jgi:hypothetical protein